MDVMTMLFCRPQTTVGTAMVLCHRFFVRRSHACHDRFVSSRLMLICIQVKSLLIFFILYFLLEKETLFLKHELNHIL